MLPKKQKRARTRNKSVRQRPQKRCHDLLPLLTRKPGRAIVRCIGTKRCEKRHGELTDSLHARIRLRYAMQQTEAGRTTLATYESPQIYGLDFMNTSGCEQVANRRGASRAFASKDRNYARCHPFPCQTGSAFDKGRCQLGAVRARARLSYREIISPNPDPGLRISFAAGRRLTAIRSADYLGRRDAFRCRSACP
jgi:hypothetical protein